jgi:hypothetical protein
VLALVHLALGVDGAGGGEQEQQDLLHRGLRSRTTCARASNWVGLTGLEPVTSSLSGKRSNRLSYRPGTGATAPS